MVKQSYKPPLTGIPVANSSSKLFGKWSNNNLLTTYVSNSNLLRNEGSCEPSTESQLFIIRPNVILFDPLLRKLINESCGLFISISNSRFSESKGRQSVNHFVKYSRKYRSVIHESIENAQSERASFSSSDGVDRFDTCISLLYNMEFIWHLTEVLYLTTADDDLALPHITQWIRFNFPEHEKSARNMIQTIQDGERTAGGVHFLNEGVENAFPEYWDILTGLILQGNVEMTRILLQLHSQSDSEMFNKADKILRNMPVYSSLQEFDLQWKIWQSNVRKSITEKIFDGCQPLKFMIQVISGDVDSVIENLKTRVPTWYQAMVGILLYTDPTIKFYELSYHAHKYIRYYGGTESINYLDKTVLALFEMDLKAAIRRFQLSSDGGWLATHMTHFLTLCGKLESQETGDGDEGFSNKHLDQKLILDYGSLLMSNKSLWQVGLCYLDQCGKDGLEYQQILLSKINFTTDAKVMKLIQAASCRGLIDVATTICKVQGVKCLQRKQLGKSLEWAFRSQDAAFASHLADQYLQHYISKGVLDSVDLIDNLGSYMLICDRLTFLSKYCEFRRLYNSAKFEEAASCLEDLISSRIAPKYFWLTLLNDALLLLHQGLNLDKPFFNNQQTSNLIFCLNDLCSLNESNLSSLLSPVQTSSFDKTVAIIRLALSKNMAKTISVEAVSGTIGTL